MERQQDARYPNVPGSTARFSRRTLLHGITATGLDAAAATLLGRTGPVAHAAARQSGQPGRFARASAPGAAREMDWQAFDAAVQTAMQTFGMVGSAVAVVNGQGIVHQQTFGVRNLASGAPVTPNTLFRVGSTTKSMTALLVATFVDEGLLDWDQPIVELWPDFRAPTAALTTTLRVRDLLGMDSGIGDPLSSELHYGDQTASQLLRSLAILPVLGAPHTIYFYNNVVYSAGGYLPLLAAGVAPAELQSAYALAMQERFFGPVGMRTARIGDDPRPYGDDYATGYALDLIAGNAEERLARVGSYAPAGGVLASVTDMAAYIGVQIRGGLSAGGGRVVSAANLEECWKPHIDLPFGPPLDPDGVSAGYAMGWASQTYRDGRRLVGHAGSVDAFTSYIAFLPEDNLGLVVLSNSYLWPGAERFQRYVLNLLLGGEFGLNRGANDAVVAAYQENLGQLNALKAQATSVDRAAIAPFLGTYERDYQLAFDAAGVLRLNQSNRFMRVLAMPDGSYISASGSFAGTPIPLVRDSSGVPVLTLQDIESVRWLVGPA